ncbi:hypothetical protein [Quisquiliibacterium transsilvanicum]|uniref:Copper resistance protein D domain-containing protein n=1 Tax=Quisquiliibacterium transsilvanicum TaxID=1549638 RepID=A0A7W8M7F7_9BURK|nr:hypothetical protein [Quisquiliibacterium transsilvanicum]MBB5270688.1 hypothetical protein [Quisquiliibacterium transsilvanicum]
MDWQNATYALVQVAHNFGAVAVVGAPLFVLWPAHPGPSMRRAPAWMVLCGWMLQGASGAAFGATSYYWYGAFPDIHGVAVAALAIKMGCALAGIGLSAALLLAGPGIREARGRLLWSWLLAAGATALTAAAFLRWFS